MFTSEIIKLMMDAHQKMNKSDILKDMPDNYVCVIHSCHRQLVERLKEANPTWQGIGTLWGIPIYEENRAPKDKIEFMDLATYYAKYPIITSHLHSQAHIILNKLVTIFRRWQ